MPPTASGVARTPTSPVRRSIPDALTLTPRPAETTYMRSPRSPARAPSDSKRELCRGFRQRQVLPRRQSLATAGQAGTTLLTQAACLVEQVGRDEFATHFGVH